MHTYLGRNSATDVGPRMKSKHRLDPPSADPAADSIFVFLQYNFPFAWPPAPFSSSPRPPISFLPSQPTAYPLPPSQSQLFSNADHQLSKSKRRWPPRSITAYTRRVDMCCIILKYFDTRGGETPPAMSFRLLDIATFSSTWVTEKARLVRVVVAKKERIQFVNLSYKLSVFFFSSFLFLFSPFFFLSLIYERKFSRHGGGGRKREKVGEG